MIKDASYMRKLQKQNKVVQKIFEYLINTIETEIKDGYDQYRYTFKFVNGELSIDAINSLIDKFESYDFTADFNYITNEFIIFWNE